MARTKRQRFWVILLKSFFFFTLVCLVLSLKGLFFPVNTSIDGPPKPEGDEFLPHLARLNNMKALANYCDSIFDSNQGALIYPRVVSDVLRKRFYHGYSHYDIYSNPIAAVLGRLIHHGADAIVIPNDILKYPYAACSQQSIVAMELLKNKGFPVRKVTMWDTVSQSGHFALEVNYDGDWHFMDTNQEPDRDVLRQYNRPSAAFLAVHSDLVGKAYRAKDSMLFERLIASQKPGVVNRFPAPNAYAFHVVTKYFAYFGWIFASLLLFLSARATRRRAKVHRNQKDTVQAIPARHFVSNDPPRRVQTG